MSQNQKSWQSFVSALQAKTEELGIPVHFEEKASWVLMQSDVNGHKFYVPKHAGEMGWCETTLPLALQPGGSPMPNDNGKIQSRYKSDLGLIEEYVLPRLAALDDRLPANRRPTRKATVSATPGVTVSNKFPGSSSTNPATIDDLIEAELAAFEDDGSAE